jgi:hypothetical protein
MERIIVGIIVLKNLVIPLMLGLVTTFFGDIQDPY